VFSFYLVVGILISVGVCNDGGHFTFVYGRFYLCCGRIPLCEHLKPRWAFFPFVGRFFYCCRAFLMIAGRFYLLLGIFNCGWAFLNY
jgi:hypothetical protein